MPTLTVVAGPNGSGKSSLTRLGREAFQEYAVLDPDAVAKAMLVTGESDASAIDAGREVLRRVEELLTGSQTFLVETNLSGNTYLRTMSRAKALDYRVVLLFVDISDVSINLQRVEKRVKGWRIRCTGGRPTPPLSRQHGAFPQGV